MTAQRNQNCGGRTCEFLECYEATRFISRSLSSFINISQSACHANGNDRLQ